jgi:hypothetical protein
MMGAKLRITSSEAEEVVVAAIRPRLATEDSDE